LPDFIDAEPGSPNAMRIEPKDADRYPEFGHAAKGWNAVAFEGVAA
jgi:hypothetical protein